MKQSILKYVTKTLLLIVIFSFLADKVVFLILNKVSDEVFTGQAIGKLNHYLLIKDNLDFVVFGSSRANHNINPTNISENSFNMGVDGSKLSYAATLIKLLPTQKKQTILLQIDPENAFSQDYSGRDIQSLSSKYNRNEIIKREIDVLKQQNLLQNFYWSLSYNNSLLAILKNYFKPNYNYKSYSGYDPIFPTEIQRSIFKQKLEKATIDKCEDSYKLNPIYKSQINDLIRFCENNNKSLILFTSPVYKDNCKDDNLQLDEILAEKGINYYDFTDVFKTNNSLNYWKDEVHLSNTGAEIFTEMIKKVITNNAKLKI